MLPRASVSAPCAVGDSHDCLLIALRFMAARYSFSATVSFDDITLPEAFDTLADSDYPESTTPTSPRQSMASRQTSDGTPTPGPVFTPEQQAWIEQLIATHGATSASTLAASSSTATAPIPSSLGKSVSSYHKAQPQGYTRQAAAACPAAWLPLPAELPGPPLPCTALLPALPCCPPLPCPATHPALPF